MTDANPKKLTPAERRALAYVLLVGWFPSGIHSRTVCSLIDYCHRHETVRAGRLYDVKDEYRQKAEAHALYRAGKVLIAKGFVARKLMRRNRTARSVDFLRPADGVEAHCYDTGYWSIDFGRERGQA